MVADPLGHCRHLGVELRALRVDRAHDAAAVVAAGGNGVEQRVMQSLDDRSNTVFQNPVKLEGLAGRDAQGFAAMRPGEFVELQPLRRAADPAWQAHPDHELIGRLQLLAPALVAQVAIVLLIDTVKLHQLDVILRRHRPGDPVKQALGDAAAQIIALVLHRLVRPKPIEGLGEIAAAVDGIGRHGSDFQ